MTNEELVRRYYGGDERALEELYRRNLGLIRRIARETAKEFNRAENTMRAVLCLPPTCTHI